MSYLVDTNILSEVRKGERCDQNVAEWWATLADEDLYLSVIVLGEVRKGIERVRPRDPAQAEAIDRWLTVVRSEFEGRILPVDQAVADEWGRMNAPRPLPILDGLLAATAKVNGLTLATRNVSDVGGTGVRFVNPFESSE
jgi:toxin FitB